MTVVFIQLDLNGNFISEFKNVRQASLSTNVNDSSIRNCCKDKIKSAGGFIWRYKDEWFDLGLDKL